MLANPRHVWTIRDLAHEAQISIGMASEILHVFADADRNWVNMHAGRGRGGIRLDVPDALLDAWCTQYTPAVTAITDLFSLDEA